MTTATTYSGSCLCGGVRFRVTAPLKFVVHCHCSLCRRAHGAPLVTWVGVVEERFALVEGGPLLARYRSTDTAERSFCSRCGSPMFFRGARWPGEIHIARALFADASLPPAQAHVFWDDRALWYDAAAKLPCLGGPSGTETISD